MAKPKPYDPFSDDSLLVAEPSTDEFSDESVFQEPESQSFKSIAGELLKRSVGFPGLPESSPRIAEAARIATARPSTPPSPFREQLIRSLPGGEISPVSGDIATMASAAPGIAKDLSNFYRAAESSVGFDTPIKKLAGKVVELGGEAEQAILPKGEQDLRTELGQTAGNTALYLAAGAVAPGVGNVTMAALESVLEGGQAYETLIQKYGEKEAGRRAMGVFAANIVPNILLNKFSGYFKGGRPAAGKFLKQAFEAIRAPAGEVTQEIYQNLLQQGAAIDPKKPILEQIDFTQLPKVAAISAVMGSAGVPISNLAVGQGPIELAEGEKITEQKADEIIKKLSAVPEEKSSDQVQKIAKEGIASSPITGETIEEIPKSSELVAKEVASSDMPMGREEKAKLINKYTQPISSRVKNIDPELAFRMRRELAFEPSVRVTEELTAIKPAIDSLKKLSKTNTSMSDAMLEAMINSETAKIDEISTNTGSNKSVNEVRKILDDVYTRAKSVGLPIEKLSGYWPRVVKEELKGEYVTSIEKDPNVKKVFNAMRLAKGDDLTFEEKMDALGKMGLRVSKVIGTGPLKSRTVKTVGKDSLRFYEPMHNALPQYIAKMENAIAAAKFLGNYKKINTETKRFDIDASVKAMTLDQMMNGKITPNQKEALDGILMSVLRPGHMTGGSKAVRNFTHWLTIVNPFTVIRQAEEMGLSAYKYGLWNSTKNLGKTIVRRGETRLHEVGVDSHSISAELQDHSSPLSSALKNIGFSGLDAGMKSVVLNSALDSAKSRAMKGEESLKKELMPMFRNDAARVSEVYEQLKNGKKNYDTLFYAFNALSDVQPVSLMEMPEEYNKAKDWKKLFWTLRSFQLKRLDLFRQDVVNKFRAGEVKSGLSNLMGMATYLAGAGIAFDVILKMLSNKPIDQEDLTWDAVFKLFGLPPYWKRIFSSKQKDKRIENAMKSSIEQIVPVSLSIFARLGDDVFNDLLYMAGSRHKGSTDKSAPRTLRSYRNIPIVGQPIYQTFGEGNRNAWKYYKEDQARKRKALNDKTKLPSMSFDFKSPLDDKDIFK